MNEDKVGRAIMMCLWVITVSVVCCGNIHGPFSRSRLRLVCDLTILIMKMNFGEMVNNVDVVCEKAWFVLGTCWTARVY